MTQETLSVLCVDDEKGMRKAVERVLETFTVAPADTDVEIRFSVTLALSAEEALDCLQRSMPDILLLDYKLPGMTGLEMLHQIHERNLDILTIIITAYASIETAITATRNGAFDFIAKPFTPDELKSVVAKAAGQVALKRQARKLAHEKRQARFETISIVAHELKAPLNAIESYLNIIKDRLAGDDPATYERLNERCLVRIQGMRKLVVDLLDLTRLESGRARRQFHDVDICAIARAAVEAAKLEAEKRSISVTLTCQEPIRLFADPKELEIVLNNLLSNGVKYNKDGGSVQLLLAPADGNVTIEVTDTGIGFTPEEGKNLFSEFHRIRNDQTRDILGSGLGLSIVRKIAALYGGKVFANSTPGAGSAFTVILPVRPPAEQEMHSLIQPGEQEARDEPTDGC